MTKVIEHLQMINIWTIAICLMVMMGTILIGNLRAAAFADVLLVMNSISYVSIHKLKETKA